jgi:hypothetical protein
MHPIQKNKRNWYRKKGIWEEWEKVLSEDLFSYLREAYLWIFYGGDPLEYAEGCKILDKLYEQGKLNDKRLMENIRYTFLKHRCWKWLFWDFLVEFHVQKKQERLHRFWWGGGLPPCHPWWKNYLKIRTKYAREKEEWGKERTEPGKKNTGLGFSVEFEIDDKGINLKRGRTESPAKSRDSQITASGDRRTSNDFK